MRIVVIEDSGIDPADSASEHRDQLLRYCASEITLISPSQSDAVRPIGFPGTWPEQAERMSRVLRSASGDLTLLTPTDSAWAVIAAIRASDGVAICGGTLSSSCPEDIFERATIGKLARLVGIPLVITDQRVGPAITADDARLVTRLLGSARIVGLRDSESFDLSRSLGIPFGQLTQRSDDAWWERLSGALLQVA